MELTWLIPESSVAKPDDVKLAPPLFQKVMPAKHPNWGDLRNPQESIRFYSLAALGAYFVKSRVPSFKSCVQTHRKRAIMGYSCGLFNSQLLA